MKFVQLLIVWVTWPLYALTVFEEIEVNDGVAETVCWGLASLAASTIFFIGDGCFIAACWFYLILGFSWILLLGMVSVFISMFTQVNGTSYLYMLYKLIISFCKKLGNLDVN